MFSSIAAIMNILTIIFSAIILIVTYLLSRQIIKVSTFLKKWNGKEILKDIPSGYPMLDILIERYKNGIKIDCDKNGNKTPERAEEYFNRPSVLGAIEVNSNLMAAAPSIISGGGVLGTFMGLAISVASFDSANSNAIMESIHTLLSGMGTAFITSIVGMIASSFYIWREKKVTNKLSQKLAKLCLNLDSEYFITTAELARIDTIKQKKELLDEIEKIREENRKNQEEFKDIFVCKDDDGFPIKPGNILQDLFEESSKQSQALSSFTTDLSNQLNSSLVQSMDSSIVPLIKNLESAHNTLVSKLETFSTNLQNPATDLVGNVVEELKSSMGVLVNEFKQGIAEDTSEKMATLANRLAETGEYLSGVPATMQTVSEKMADKFSDIQVLIENLQKSAAKISEETMQNMQGQMGTVTTALASAVNGLQDQQQSIVEQNRMANDMAIDRLKTQFDDIMISFKGLSDKLENQHEEMVGRQATSMKEVERLLNSFNSSIDLLRTSNNETGNTLSKLTLVSSAIDTSAENLKVLASTMASTAEDLAKQQDERMAEFKALQESNLKLIDTVNESTEKAQNLMNTYTSEYPVIKEGLTEIFDKISEGLQDYSKTLRTSTGDALTEYASALEKSTKSLQNIAANLNDTADELVDGIEQFKLRNK